MNITKFKIYLLMILGLGFTNAYTQSATVASGGDLEGEGGSIAFSIGQVAYTINSGETGTVLQGIQQPYEIYSVGIEDFTEDLSITLYPNPTFSKIFLEFGDLNTENLNYYLLNPMGKLITQADLTEQKTLIDLNAYVAGNYFLVVTQNEKLIKTFKIIKNK